MTKHRIIEILCVIVLAVFIIGVSSDEKVSDKTAKEVASEILSSLSFEETREQTKLEIKKELNLSDGSYSSICYYKSDDIMNVKELLVIKLSQNKNAEEAKEKILDRLSQKQTLFEGYAPKQSALLKNYVFKERAGFIIFSVSDDPELLLKVISDIL